MGTSRALPDRLVWSGPENGSGHSRRVVGRKLRLELRPYHSEVRTLRPNQQMVGRAETALRSEVEPTD